MHVILIGDGTVDVVALVTMLSYLEKEYIFNITLNSLK